MIPSDAWPRGDRLEWYDDEARLLWNFAEDPHESRPYAAEENAVADVREAERLRLEVEERLRSQLISGVAAVTAARDAAVSDRVVAQTARTNALTVKAQATTQRTQVAAFVPAATYNAAQLAAVRDAITAVIGRQELILQALADLQGYRTAVDDNAVTTDNALLWLARLVAELYDDEISGTD